MNDGLLNYMNQINSLRNDFPSLLDFDFIGDMIEIDDVGKE